MKRPLDPYEEMMRGALTFMIIAFMVAVFLILHGCVNAPVAPNLKLPETQSCPKLDIKPLPTDVQLVVHGDKVEADAGGEYVLRSFAACRAALR